MASRSLPVRVVCGPLVLLGLGLSCGDAPTAPTGAPVAALVASMDSVVIEPGDSTRLRAEARDAAGRPMPPSPVQWRSLSTSVASVSPEGTVQARAAGQARIVATLRGRSDTVHVVVPAPITQTRLSARLDTITRIGDRVTVEVSSQSVTGPRLGRYTVTSRDSGVATPWLEPHTGTLGVIGQRAGATWIVVKERHGSADSLRIVVAPRAAHVVLPEKITGAVGGSVQLSPTVFDDRFATMPASSLVWTSADSTIATVSASGLVRMHALGMTYIEARANEDAVAFVGVIVSSGAQPRLAFRMDTLTTGAGLVVPNVFVDMTNLPGASAAAVTLDPSVAEITSVTQYSGTLALTIAGRRAGVTKIVASSANATPDTLVVRVTTSRVMILSRSDLSSIEEDDVAVGSEQYYMISVRDSLGTFHERAGSVVVTLRSSDTTVLRVADGQSSLTLGPGDGGTPGARVIPAGAGRAVLYATAPGLLDDSVIVNVGAGPRLQFRGPRVHSVALGYRTVGDPFSIGTTLGMNRNTDVTITLTRKHAEVATAPSTISLPSNYIWRAIDYTGLALGTDTIIASAPGYESDTVVLVVTSPVLAPTSPMRGTVAMGAGVPLRVTDSLGVAMLSLSPTTFRVTSSNTDVADPPASVTIPKDVHWQWYANAGVRDTGSAIITITDTTGRIAPRSVPLTVAADTSLALGNQRDGYPMGIGMRQLFMDDAFYVIREGYSTTTVYLQSTNPAVLRVPDSVVIGGLRGTHVQVTGGDSPGTASIIATARGYRAVTFGPIEVGRPAFHLDAPDTVYVGGTEYTADVIARDHLGRVRNAPEDVPVDLVALDGGIAAASSALIRAGSSRSGTIPLTITAPGTLRLEARDPRSATYRYASDTVVIQAVLPPLAFGYGGPILVGVGQRTTTSIGRPGNVRSNAAEVSVTRRGSRTSSAAAATIPAGATGITYAIVGRAIGVDTLVAAAPGYSSGTARVVVTEGHIQVESYIPPSLEVGASFAMSIAVSDSTGQRHPVDEPTTFSLWGSGVTFSNGQVAITSITLPAGATQSVPFRVIGAKAGTATIEITRLGYRPERIEVTVVP